MLVGNSTHLSFLEGTNNLPPIIVGPDPALARFYLQVLSLAFFNTYLKNQTKFQLYLNPTAISTLSKDPLPLHILPSLTPKQLQEAITQN